MSRIPLSSYWRVFTKKYNLSEHQVAQFELYIQELKEWNSRIDLTTLTNDQEILELHFDDSMQMTKFIDVPKLNACADVGSGGGFPGIPLNILYPELPIYLIEVKRKRIQFLEHIIDALALKNVFVFTVDWRTFLRKTDFAIDLFCARASLEVGELVRMFKPSSPYRNAQLIYWASQSWEPEKYVRPHVTREWPYHVAGRQRRLVVLAVSESSRVGA